MMLLPRGSRASQALLSALLAVTCLPRANGFFPSNWREQLFGNGGVSHQKMTEDAFGDLAKQYFPYIPKLTKSMLNARNTIRQANEDVDDDQEHSAKHFDGENFDGGADRLVTLGEQVVSSLQAKKADDARHSLGEALHTLQDFYAHSNWVELGNGDINHALGNQRSISHASFTETTCRNCTGGGYISCPNCDGNALSLLTSGYYFGEDSPAGGAAIPDYKCHHGGITDNSRGAAFGIFFGDITPGINKDSNNCHFSPHSSLHPQAASLAKQATKTYIDNLKLTDAEKRLLFGVGSTMAFAIDTTGSMSGIISSVRQQAIQIAQDRQGTADEPSQYVVAPFNDPTTGPATITSDFSEFQSNINALGADGGGDCPELSMTGLLDAMSLISGAADLFLMTDAAAKDEDMRSEVISTANKQNINIHIYKFDSGCDDGGGGGGASKREDSASNRVYGEVARGTGGSYHSLPDDQVDNISNMLDVLTNSDSTGILTIDDTVSSGGALDYNVPVDSAMSQLSISLRGTGVSYSITRPDGSALDPSSDGVTTTTLDDGHFTTVRSPGPGMWKVSVSGDGPFALDATGVTSLHLSAFDFVAIGGRDGHRGYYPIATQPAYDHDVAAVGQVDGDYSDATFDMRSPTGAHVADTNMQPGSGDDGEPPANSYFGRMHLLPGTQYAYCAGTDAAGAPFQRFWPTVFTPELSGTTDTGIDDSNPLLSRSSMSSTDTTSTNTSTSTSTSTSTNSTTSTTTTTSTSSSTTSTTSSTTSTSSEGSGYPTKSATTTTPKPVTSYPHTPAPYPTQPWHNPHTCEPGVIYTHSYGDLHPCTTCGGPNYNGGGHNNNGGHKPTKTAPSTAIASAGGVAGGVATHPTTYTAVTKAEGGAADPSVIAVASGTGPSAGTAPTANPDAAGGAQGGDGDAQPQASGGNAGGNSGGDSGDSVDTSAAAAAPSATDSATSAPDPPEQSGASVSTGGAARSNTVSFFELGLGAVGILIAAI